MTAAEIRRRRDELGLTQAQLGAALDVHPNTVAKWERGEQTPEHPKMLRLALDCLSGPQRRRSWAHV